MAREKVITLKLSLDEHRRYGKLAKDMGLTVSAMIRALVREREKENNENRRRGKE
jgi:hypothetical protein